MEETSDYGDVDHGNHNSEGTSTNLAQNNSITSTDTCSNDNRKNDATEISDYGDETSDIDDGTNNSESNSLAHNYSLTSTGTWTTTNSKNDRNTGFATNPKIAGEGVGRGYDANIPAVFKAKVSEFPSFSRWNVLRN